MHTGPRFRPPLFPIFHTLSANGFCASPKPLRGAPWSPKDGRPGGCARPARPVTVHTCKRVRSHARVRSSEQQEGVPDVSGRCVPRSEVSGTADSAPQTRSPLGSLHWAQRRSPLPHAAGPASLPVRGRGFRRLRVWKPGRPPRRGPPHRAPSGQRVRSTGPRRGEAGVRHRTRMPRALPAASVAPRLCAQKPGDGLVGGRASDVLGHHVPEAVRAGFQKRF